MKIKGNDITNSVSDSLLLENDYTTNSDFFLPEDDNITNLVSVEYSQVLMEIKSDDITDLVSVESLQVSMKMKEEIICTYQKMKTQSKWHLLIGKYVEDALFNFLMTVIYEQ